MHKSLIITPTQGQDFVELSAGVETLPEHQGRLFKKAILNTGPLFYPGVSGGKVDITPSMFSTIIKNFRNKVCGIVQVPKVDEKNRHTEDPDRNIGQVVDLSMDDHTLYAIIDARDESAADKLGKTLIGASAMLNLNYTDTRTNEKVGPTLVHVAVTNHPYVSDLAPFEEIIKASSDSESEAVLLSAVEPKTEEPVTLDELKATLKTEFEIDVDGLQAEVQDKTAKLADTMKLSAAVSEKLADAGVLELSAGEDATIDTLITAVDTAAADLKLSKETIEAKDAEVVELSSKVEAKDAEIVDLSAKLEAAETEKRTSEAIARVDDLVREGRILPANKDAQVELLLSNSELFEKLLPEKPLIALSVEQGHDEAASELKRTVEDEIERISSEQNL